ncbi:hypothetical protein [Apilactobacillus timberlakei]|uniref:Scaffolding protein n=1 Tax=Apilactobacillus timberlakei TaxID=2008380 RepID=A0ABY2YRI9_9LACO|nr:hypothetical protein [Apilactobacillus timberlakei]TPR12745.1 hypothetical protein DY048_06965 [Apilactobacillus timberlakei]TPR13628.1 hypothetical protein DY052_07835 [Apilactobacillus timberlakei]
MAEDATETTDETVDNNQTETHDEQKSEYVKSLERRINNLETKNNNKAVNKDTKKETKDNNDNVDSTKYVSIDEYNELKEKIGNLENKDQVKSIKSDIQSKAKEDGIKLTANDLKFIVTKDADTSNSKYEYIKKLKADSKPADKDLPKDTKRKPKENIGSTLAKSLPKQDLSYWIKN